jgi:hypothetical protein
MALNALVHPVADGQLQILHNLSYQMALRVQSASFSSGTLSLTEVMLTSRYSTGTDCLSRVALNQTIDVHGQQLYISRLLDTRH